MTNKPSILIVCHNPPWRIGGVEKHVGEIARICRKKHKMEITIYCSSPDKEETGLSVWNDVPVRVFKRTEVFPYWPSGLFQAIKAVKGSGNFDLIHIQGIRSLEPLLTVLGNRGGIPYCITPHFHPVATNIFFSLVKNIFDPLLVKRIFANSKKIICVSETEEQLLIVSFGKEIRLKTQIVGTGIDISNVRLNPRKP